MYMAVYISAYMRVLSVGVLPFVVNKFLHFIFLLSAKTNKTSKNIVFAILILYKSK